MTEDGFDSLWRESVTFRRVSHALAPLVERGERSSYDRSVAV